MEPKRGEQANHAPRGPFCSLGEGVEFRYRRSCRRVETTARPDHEALLLGEQKVLAGDSVDAEVSRPKNPGRLGEFRDSGYGFGGRHYLILHNVGCYLQVPTRFAFSDSVKHPVRKG